MMVRDRYDVAVVYGDRKAEVRMGAAGALPSPAPGGEGSAAPDLRRPCNRETRPAPHVNSGATAKLSAWIGRSLTLPCAGRGRLRRPRPTSPL